VQTYYRQVAGAVNSDEYGGWVFPCAGKNMPGFGVTVGGEAGGMKRTFVVEGQGLVYGQVSERMCYGGVQENQGLPFGILGDGMFVFPVCLSGFVRQLSIESFTASRASFFCSC